MRLYELLNRPEPFHWVEQSANWWRGIFVIAGIEYSIVCDREKDYPDPDDPAKDAELWELRFSPSDNGLEDEVIGTGGNEFKIFSTVIAGLREFLNSVHPPMFAISADVKQPNRIVFYQTLLRRFAAELDTLGYRRIACPKHRMVDTSKVAHSTCFQRIK